MILVTGATGSIGRPLVAELHRRGAAFRSLVRDPARANLPGAVAVGDFDDPASLDRALDGVTRVFLCSPGAVPAPGPQPMIAQQGAVIEAAVRAGVRRIVKVSVQGARAGGLLAEGAHAVLEERLRAAGPEWVLLRPSGFMQNFRTGTGAFTADGDLVGAYGEGRVAYIDAADIAACAVPPLLESGYAGETFVLTGPEALSHTEIAAQLTAATGRAVRYRDLPAAEFAETLVAQGLPAPFAADVAALFAEVARGGLATVTDTVELLTGRPATTFRAFLARERALG
ncbi:SDR family oxidoreductase [Nocardia asteroides]|uniref:SDR family oxidoreductase n=1 Tax=Nocardia asteroides TaxID=1824 RepID=UPI001E2C072D|nr:SDR family oxidoreductase [Nocardia asteroides]UGT61160.1 SDR family oxidoreductase [Nocardia asteroides]